MSMERQKASPKTGVPLLWRFVSKTERALVQVFKKKKLSETIKQLNIQAEKSEMRYNDEVKHREKVEEALATEEKDLNLLEKNLAKVKLQLEPFNDMRLKAEELERKPTAEISLRRQSQSVLSKEKNLLNGTRQLLIEQEKLTSQALTWRNIYHKESSLRKETEDALSRKKQEFEQLKSETVDAGSYEKMTKINIQLQEERDNALNVIEEIMTERRSPESFICPISQEVMKDPHIAADGYTYEAEAIRGWLRSGHNTSPMTNLKLSHLNLVPNRALQSAIQEFV